MELLHTNKNIEYLRGRSDELTPAVIKQVIQGNAFTEVLKLFNSKNNKQENCENLKKIITGDYKDLIDEYVQQTKSLNNSLFSAFCSIENLVKIGYYGKEISNEQIKTMIQNVTQFQIDSGFEIISLILFEQDYPRLELFQEEYNRLKSLGYEVSIQVDCPTVKMEREKVFNFLENNDWKLIRMNYRGERTYTFLKEIKDTHNLEIHLSGLPNKLVGKSSNKFIPLVLEQRNVSEVVLSYSTGINHGYGNNLFTLIEFDSSNGTFREIRKTRDVKEFRKNFSKYLEDASEFTAWFYNQEKNERKSWIGRSSIYAES